MSVKHLTAEQYLNMEDAGFGPGKLSKYFSFEEMCRSEIARRNNINNYPTEDRIVRSMESLCRTTLDLVREKVGRLYMLSGYRSPFVNKKVGSNDLSLHPHGMAGDVLSYNMTVWQLFQRALEIKYLPFHEIIFEFASWIHIGYRNWKDAGNIKIIVFDKRIEKNPPVIKETYTRLQYDAGIVEERLKELGYLTGPEKV